MAKRRIPGWVFFLAAVLVAVLDTAGTVGKTFEVISGDTPIADAVTASAQQ